MSTNLPMVHVADLEGNDGVNDTDYIVLGQGTDARKITVAALRAALGIDVLSTKIAQNTITRKNTLFSNVACTSKSGNGVYYGTVCKLTDLGVSDPRKITGLFVGAWSGMSAAPSLYVQNGEVRVLSDIPQTIGALEVYISYVA